MRPTTPQTPNQDAHTTGYSDEGITYMPATNRLVRQPGVVFANFVLATPLCAPSRSVILTGRMPHNTGVFLNSPVHGAYEYWAKIENTSVAVALQRSGYVTFLAGKFMHEPVHVAVERPSLTARNIVQVAYSVGGLPDKLRLLKSLLRTEKPEQALIFVATRERTAEVADVLRRSGEAVASISSLLSQANRERTLAGFRDGTHKILVGTDVAGRGLDISGITHVFNFDVPHDPNDYVHRVGRTGRAGRSGRALTLVSGQDRPYLQMIENHIGMKLERGEGFTSDETAAKEAGDAAGRGPRRGSGSRGGGGGGRAGGGGGRGGGGARSGSRGAGAPKGGGRGSGSGSGRGRSGRRSGVKKPGTGGGGQKPSSGSSSG